MPLRHSTTSLIPVVPPPPPVPAVGPLPATALDTTISQEHANWCWAACVQLVLKNRGTAHSQCQLASSVLRLGGPCCKSPLPASCDDGLTVKEITELFHNNGVTGAVASGPLTKPMLESALALGRPVAIAFDWGHMCLVYGRQSDSQGDKFLVYDPLGPAFGTLSFAGIMNYGVGSHTWDTSWTGL